MTDANILTRKELATNLGVTERTIRRWEKSGLPYLSVSRIKRYDYKAVLQWMLNKATEKEIIL